MGRVSNAFAALAGRPSPASVPTTEKGYAAPSNPLGGWWSDTFEDTPELKWPKSVETYDKMRRQDAQVKSVLKAITLPILATDWYIDPNGADAQVAAFVAHEVGLRVRGDMGVDEELMSRAKDRFSMPDHLRLALTMLPFGHSLFEQVYRYGDEDGLFHLRKLAWRPPWTIRKFNVATDGGLISIQQRPAVGVQDTPEIPVDRLVVYVNEREGGRWEGQSAIRPAYKDWILKDLLLRVQTQSAERNGMGVVVYKGAEIPDLGDQAEMVSMQQKDITQGLEIATSVRSGESAGAAIPNSAELELKGVDGDLPDMDAPIRYHDEQIARSVLAHFLNLGQQTGSWALGSTFADFFSQSLQGVAVAVADVFTAHVIEDLVDVNFGKDVPAPRLAFDAIGAKHVPTAQEIAALVKTGVLWKGPALENYVRTMYDIPAEKSIPDEGTTDE